MAVGDGVPGAPLLFSEDQVYPLQQTINILTVIAAMDSECFSTSALDTEHHI